MLEKPSVICLKEQTARFSNVLDSFQLYSLPKRMFLISSLVQIQHADTAL